MLPSSAPAGPAIGLPTSVFSPRYRPSVVYEDPDLDERVEKALSVEERPLGLYDIRSAVGASDVETQRALQRLLRAKRVQRAGAHWRAAGPLAQHPTAQTAPPRRSKIRDEVPRGWDAVRALCRYYHDCLELEAGASASFNAKDSSAQGVEVTQALDWNLLASGESVRVPATQELLRQIAESDRNRLRLAGPLEVLPPSRKAPACILPILLMGVVATRRSGAVEIRMESEPRINEAWISARFRGTQEGKRNEVLIRLGFLVEEDPGDGEMPKLIPTTGLRMDEAWAAALRMAELDWQEEGDARRLLGGAPWTTLTRPGVYNRLLLLPAVSSPFTMGAMDELRQIATRSDDDLRQTALVSFFAPLLKDEGSRPVALPEAHTSRPEFQPLNAEQREVVEHALESPFVAVQGPPGTGKSLTVTHVLTAEALSGHSALFASRNHRALEAVVPRLQAIDPDHPLIYRLTRSADDSRGTEDNWVGSILQLAGRPVPEGALSLREESLGRLRATLELRDTLEAELSKQLRVAAELGVANEEVARIESLVDPRWIDLCQQATARNAGWLKRALTVVERYEVAPWRSLRWLAAWHIKRVLHRLRALQSQSLAEIPSGRDGQQSLLRALGQWGMAQMDRARLESTALEGGSRADLVERLEAADEQAREATRGALEAFTRSMGAQLDDEFRSDVANLRGELGRRNISSSLNKLPPLLKAAVDRLFRGALSMVPLWACSNLSIRSRLPLLAGAFDLVVIDEASQCDIPSCIPLLYRARRALIVGDPQQLQHVAKLGREAENRIRDVHGLSSIEIGAYLHSTNSVWNPAAAVARSAGGETFMLREHWRCHPEIARYVSEHFYGGGLKVRTPIEASPPVVRGSRLLRGIEWTHVPGGSEAAPGGSRYWPLQIDAIVDELRRVAESGFEGTVGVVTPFRAHADRVRDAVARALPAEQLKRWRFASQTADGFQGDERDLVLFGLVGGPDPSDVPPFYARDRNRFNVAVSRARGLLHVFGDRDWATQCGLETLTGLAEAWRRCQQQSSQPIRTDLIGPVWEPRFAEALRAAGIDFHQQYPACGFYLDFAILRPDIKLALEVDGETYHRDSNGNLRVEDVRRDQMLRAAGWQVERFWVYQLRESLDGCIEHVQSIIARS
jgi:very-short-patch-repair endonuclease